MCLVLNMHMFSQGWVKSKCSELVLVKPIKTMDLQLELFSDLQEKEQRATRRWEIKVNLKQVRISFGETLDKLSEQLTTDNLLTSKASVSTLKFATVEQLI